MRCWEGGREDDFTGEAKMAGGGIVGVTRCASSDTSISPGGKLRVVVIKEAGNDLVAVSLRSGCCFKTGNCSNV